MIHARRALTLALLTTISLAACDAPAPRVLKRAPQPVPGVRPVASDPVATPAAQAASQQFPAERPSPILWNPSRNAFEFNGRPLRAEKVWTFDGATDGFVVTHGEVTPADGAGMSVRVGGRDAIMRSPRGLNVAGANRSLLLVRLTRTGAAKRWDPTVYYSTPAHGETQAFFAKPAFAGHPNLNDTVTMVFNMHGLAAGGDDWKSSVIDQVRLDVDDGPGGAFVVQQVAIAQDPGGIFPAPPTPAKEAKPEKPAADPKSPAADLKPSAKPEKKAAKGKATSKPTK